MTPNLLQKAPAPAEAPLPRVGSRSRLCNALVGFATASAWANESPEIEWPAGGLEAMPEASNAAEGWYRIAGYRDYLHPAGVQRVSKQAAENMQQHFNSAVSRVKRALGIGQHRIPIYRGHPDAAAFANNEGHSDTTVYGSVDQVEAREDGLYVHVAWANEWEQLRDKLSWRFSPRWAMRHVSGRVFEPRKLISIGLTDRPNLPDAAFANSQKNIAMNELLKQLLAKLGFANERITATEQGAADAVSLSEALAKLGSIETELANEKAEHAKTKQSLEAAHSAKTTAETEAANERQERAKLVVDAAVAAGRIKAADRDEWQGKLAKAEKFTEAANELANKKAELKTQSTTDNLGNRRGSALVSEAANEFQTLVSEKTKAGMPYDAAYAATKTSAKGKELLERMAAEAE